MVCKKELQKRFNLPVRDVPIFGFIARLVHQKGADILAEAIYKITFPGSAVCFAW